MARSLLMKAGFNNFAQVSWSKKVTEDTDHKTRPDEIDLEIQRPDNVDNKSASKEETGGPKGPEPTRYGDWERKGRCIDF